jgi:hypothetical protein
MSIKQANEALSWFSAHGDQFAAAPPGAEFLHELKEGADPTASETYWFAFSLADAGILAHFYTVLRQGFPSAMAGAWVYRGVAPDPLLIEHMNYRYSVPKPSFMGSRLPIPQVGLEFDIVEPTKHWSVTYRAPDGSAEAKLNCVALSPLVMAPSGEHFDQAIWCKGTLRVGNENFVVDSPGFRDRTWNAPRGEDRLNFPPLDYIWGVLDDGAASFCVRGGDDPARGAEWVGKFSLTTEQVFHGGWIFVNGELRAVTKMSKQTERDFLNKARPLTQRIELVDATGENHHIEGRSIGAMFYQPWGNVGAWMSHMQWTLNGTRSGEGEVQEMMFSEYAKAFWK